MTNSGFKVREKKFHFSTKSLQRVRAMKPVASICEPQQSTQRLRFLKNRSETKNKVYMACESNKRFTRRFGPKISSRNDSPIDFRRTNQSTPFLDRIRAFDNVCSNSSTEKSDVLYIWKTKNSERRLRQHLSYNKKTYDHEINYAVCSFYNR